MNQGLLQISRNRKFHQAIAVKIHRRFFAGSQHHFSPVRNHNTLVGNLGREQSGITALGHLNQTLIDHRRIFRTRFQVERVMPIHKIFIGDIQDRGHKTRCVDHRSGAKQNSVGVDQKNFSVGIQTAQNRRGISARHAV